MVAKLGDLIAAQVQRSKQQESVVVQLAASLPSDGSLVNLDWWLRQMNTLLSPISISLEFADLDNPGQSVGQVSPIQVVQMRRQIEELQVLVDGYENHMHEKAAKLADAIMAASGSAGMPGLSKKETALRAVDNDGVYLDETGARWVDIATEAKRIGNKSYITLWRASKKIGCNSIESMVVGTTNAGGDRILVKQGSFTTGKRKRRNKSK